MTILRAEYILGHRDGDHVLWRDAEVEYHDGRIEYVGSRRSSSGSADEVIDLDQSVVLPGFVDLDAVCDVDHALLDSSAGPDVGPRLAWSAHYFEHERRDVLTPSERATVREYALAQLLLGGVTTMMPIASEVHSAWAETFDDLVDLTDAARRLGIRGYFGPSYRSGVRVTGPDGPEVRWDEERGRQGLADALRYLDYVDDLGDPLIRAALLPCRIETLTEELMRETAAAARDRQALVRLHCMQGAGEIPMLQRSHRGTTLELLKRTGLLDTRLLIPHAIYTGAQVPYDVPDPQVLAALVAADVSVIHCPLTSARYAMALRSFDSYLDAGINLAIGTDSFPPDFIRNLDYGSNIAKVVEGRMDAGRAADLVRAATLGGARAVGRDDLGRLEPGAAADLIAYDLTDVRFGVVDDPIRTLLMNGNARDLRLSVIDGEVAVRDGQVLGADLASLTAEAQRLFGKLRAAYSERAVDSAPVEVLFPPAFPAAEV